MRRNYITITTTPHHNTYTGTAHTHNTYNTNLTYSHPLPHHAPTLRSLFARPHQSHTSTHHTLTYTFLLPLTIHHTQLYPRHLRQIHQHPTQVQTHLPHTYTPTIGGPLRTFPKPISTSISSKTETLFRVFIDRSTTPLWKNISSTADGPRRNFGRSLPN